MARSSRLVLGALTALLLFSGIASAQTAPRKKQLLRTWQVEGNDTLGDYVASLTVTDGGRWKIDLEATLTYAWMLAKGGEDARGAVLRIIEEEGIDAAVAAFDQMLEQRDEDYFFDENAFNRLGYRFLGEDRIEEAVAVFEMNVKAYPESWNPWDSLGEGYAARGEIDRAIAAYKKSIELNPDNENGVAQLERLKAEKAGGS